MSRFFTRSIYPTCPAFSTTSTGNPGFHDWFRPHKWSSLLFRAKPGSWGSAMSPAISREALSFSRPTLLRTTLPTSTTRFRRRFHSKSGTSPSTSCIWLTIRWQASWERTPVTNTDSTRFIIDFKVFLLSSVFCLECRFLYLYNINDVFFFFVLGEHCSKALYPYVHSIVQVPVNLDENDQNLPHVVKNAMITCNGKLTDQFQRI